MSEHSPNLNLNLYSEADGEEKFRSFVEKLAGPGADSNMMLLDAAIKAQAEKLKKAALLDGTGKLPDSLLPEIGAEHIPFIPGNAFQSAVGDASNVSDALEKIGKVSADAYAHIENRNNPHGVTAEKINAVPVSRTINGQSLSDDITLTPSDIGITAKRTCRFVVGTSTAGWTADDCDFLCDGVDDDIELNQAISDALSFGPGQEIVILGGKYNLSSALNYVSDITLIGQMSTPSNIRNTWLQLSGGTNISLVGDFVGLRNLYITGGNVLAPSDLTGVNFCSIENCNATISGNFSRSKIIGHRGNIYLYNSTMTSILQWSPGNGVSIQLQDCSFISIFGSFKDSSTTSGSIHMTGVTRSTLFGNSVATIYISNGCADNVLTGNVVRAAPYIGGTAGIQLYGANRNAIVGNLVYPYDAGDTIKLCGDSCDNLVANNLIFGKNYVTEGGTGNTFVNNKYN